MTSNIKKINEEYSHSIITFDLNNFYDEIFSTKKIYGFIIKVSELPYVETGDKGFEVWGFWSEENIQDLKILIVKVLLENEIKLNSLLEINDSHIKKEILKNQFENFKSITVSNIDSFNKINLEKDFFNIVESDYEKAKQYRDNSFSFEDFLMQESDEEYLEDEEYLDFFKDEEDINFGIRKKNINDITDADFEELRN